MNYLVSADWLVDRRHCNLKWQNVVKDIREKINAAIQDMPENEEIKQLLSGSCKCFTSSFFKEMYCNIIALLVPHFMTASQVCLFNCLIVINRHSLLPLLENCRDPKGHRSLLQEHLWQILLSEDEGDGFLTPK